MILPIRLFLLPLIGVTLLLGGCVTHITTDVTQNPPPVEKFSDFTKFEIEALTMVPPYAGQEANEVAMKKIQANVSQKATPLFEGWNATGAGKTPARTLLVKPVITEIKFISGGKRFWAGAMAGSSAIILNAKITEKETGKVIATPQFYARAAAMGGAWTIGSTDNVMLLRIANRLTDYLAANYDEAKGGPSGAEPVK